MSTCLKHFSNIQTTCIERSKQSNIYISLKKWLGLKPRMAASSFADNRDYIYTSKLFCNLFDHINYVYTYTHMHNWKVWVMDAAPFCVDK